MVIKPFAYKNFSVVILYIVMIVLPQGGLAQQDVNTQIAYENNSKKLFTDNEKEKTDIEAEINARKILLRSLIDRTNEIPALLKKGKIKASDIPNPHWKKESCVSCHTKPYGEASKKNLRNKKHDRNCLNCHGNDFDHNYIHPINIKPSAIKKQAMNADMIKQLKQTNGKITCSTCHDISLQCRLENKQRHENEMFFREGPYSNRYDLCIKCHKPEDYKRFNPHEHVNENGEITEQKCRVCHSGSIDELSEAESIDEVGFHVDENLNSICWGCHQWKPHPGGGFSFFKSKSGPNHLVKPSAEVLKRINKTLKEKNILMPLEPDSGKVFCATCHNPHAIGVVSNKSAATGADSKSRLRSENICSNCHIM